MDGSPTVFKPVCGFAKRKRWNAVQPADVVSRARVLNKVTRTSPTGGDARDGSLLSPTSIGKFAKAWVAARLTYWMQWTTNCYLMNCIATCQTAVGALAHLF